MGLAHVILHIGFCAAIARPAPQTTIAVRVRLVDRSTRTNFDRTFTVERGDESEAVVEFDSAFGIRRLDVVAPKYGCSTTDYLFFIPDHTRAVTEKLGEVPPSPQVP